MLTPVNDPKYYIADGQFINRASNISIPDDEPVFIFRARDHWAVAALTHYVGLVRDEHHQEVVGQCLRNFIDFARDNPERMKEPDTQPTEDK